MTEHLVWQLVQVDNDKYPSADEIITRACAEGKWEVSERELTK
jgi:hypothetical protein